MDLIKKFLEKRDQTFIAEYNPGNSTGDPKYYANYNDKNIIVAPTPASALAIQIQYVKIHHTSIQQHQQCCQINTKIYSFMVF